MQIWIRCKNKVIQPIFMKRVLYTLCFVMLCVIDQRRGSAVGEVQMIFANCTGFVMAAIILSGYRWRDFMKKPYLVWLIVAAIGTPVAMLWGKTNYPYWGQWNTAVLNVAVYGFIVIRLFYKIVIDKESTKINKPFFFLWATMLVLMLLSRNEAIWPLWFLVMFGSFYLTDYSKEERAALFGGMLDGMIIGFFLIQGLAFVFRPYDYLRYRGLYSGETQNGLFYLMSYCAFLCKWMWLKEKGSKKIWQWSCFAMAGAMVSFIAMTMGKSPIVAAAVVTLMVFILFNQNARECRKIFLIRCVTLGVCIVISFPMVYGCIRYIPAVFHHPIWYEGEYHPDTSVHSYDDWKSHKYIRFSESLDYAILRYFPFLNPLSVSAAGKDVLEAGSSPDYPYNFSDTNMSSSSDIRKVIYSYYLQQLNIVGHETQENGFWITEGIFLEHAHNMFLQIAFDFGLASGLLMIGIIIYSAFNKLSKSIKYAAEKARRVSMLCFIMAVCVFGMFEVGTVIGQMSFTILFICICDREDADYERTKVI